MNIAFLGTSTFAVPSLVRLFEEGYKITGVVTQSDKPSGRGQEMQAPPVKRKALELQLPVYQPKSLKDEQTQAMFAALEAEIMIVVAYGKILPKWLLELSRYGCINLHGSILPKYRGAAPVHWAIANGETKTGVCTMQLDPGMDTGPVYLCEETGIGPEESVQEIYDRLAGIGAPLMSETIKGIVNGTLHARPQDHSQSSLAPILKKEHGFIDWNMTAAQIHNRVRAFNPWPGTVTKFRGRACKILKTRVAADQADSTDPGLIVAYRHSLSVVCGGPSMLEVLTIQPENRKPVSGTDFVNGAHMQPGEKFHPMMDN
jgi:methionyl-tRNA formyltransferase